MRRFVNGDEFDLDPSHADASWVGNRLVVHSNGVTLSAVAVTLGEAVIVSYRGHQYCIERKSPRVASHHHMAEGEIRSTMPGSIVEVKVAQGDKVSRGQSLLVLEAMKTHQPFVAPFDGVVESIAVAKGDQVSEGQVLVIVGEA